MAPDATERSLEFDSWIAGRSAALTRFAYVLTGSEVAAEQALASALIVAAATWKRVRRSDDPEAHVLRLVVRAHLAGRGRSPRRASLVEPSPAEAEGISAPAHDGDDDDDDDDDDDERAWQLCSVLPPTERAAIVLRCYAEQTYPQIAATLDTKEAAVRDIVGRCFAALSHSARAGRPLYQPETAFREAFLGHGEDPGNALDLASRARRNRQQPPSPTPGRCGSGRRSARRHGRGRVHI